MFSRMPRVVDGRLLGEDRDALLALEVARIHDPVDERLVRPERAGLAEHRVDERGLAVVHVRDDRDIAQVGTRGGRVEGGHGGAGAAESVMGAAQCRTSVVPAPPGRRRLLASGDDDRGRRDPVRDRRWRPGRDARAGPGPTPGRPRLVRRCAPDRRACHPIRTARSRRAWPGARRATACRRRPRPDRSVRWSAASSSRRPRSTT